MLTQAEDEFGTEAKQVILVAENLTADLARADTGDELSQPTLVIVDSGVDIGDDVIGPSVCSAVALQQRYT
ncbi:MAG: hypothetical protein ACYDEY_06900 [Acidimicrobiales bacterium]